MIHLSVFYILQKHLPNRTFCPVRVLMQSFTPWKQGETTWWGLVSFVCDSGSNSSCFTHGWFGKVSRTPASGKSESIGKTYMEWLEKKEKKAKMNVCKQPAKMKKRVFLPKSFVSVFLKLWDCLGCLITFMLKGLKDTESGLILSQGHHHLLPLHFFSTLWNILLCGV